MAKFKINKKLLLISFTALAVLGAVLGVVASCHTQTKKDQVQSDKHNKNTNKLTGGNEQLYISKKLLNQLLNTLEFSEATKN